MCLFRRRSENEKKETATNIHFVNNIPCQRKRRITGQYLYRVIFMNILGLMEIRNLNILFSFKQNGMMTLNKVIEWRGATGYDYQIFYLVGIIFNKIFSRKVNCYTTGTINWFFIKITYIELNSNIIIQKATHLQYSRKSKTFLSNIT